MEQFLINYFSISYSLFPMVIIGCYGFRELDKFYKLFLLQAVIALGVYAIVAYDFSANNQTLYNVYIAVEYMILMLAAAAVFSKQRERLWILAGFSFFAIVFALNLVWKGANQLTNYAVAAGAIPVLIIYLILIYRSSQNKNSKAMVWLCLGLVIYFCGNAPFLALMGFLEKNYPKLNEVFQLYILESLGHLRYILAAVSFWLYLRHRRSSNTQSTLWPKEI